MDIINRFYEINPINKQIITTIGGGNLVNCKIKKVIKITIIFIKLLIVKEVMLISLSKNNVAAHIKPTTTALIPSRAL